MNWEALIKAQGLAAFFSFFGNNTWSYKARSLILQVLSINDAARKNILSFYLSHTTKEI